MGSLVLPTSGTVYVDTQVVIYTVERHPVYLPLLDLLWRAAQAGSITVVSSELTLMECMVMPMRTGNTMLRDAYD